MRHGVLKSSLKRIPQCVIQTKFHNETMRKKSHGTVKMTLLQRDLDVTDLVEMSIYDSKSIFFK